MAHQRKRISKGKWRTAAEANRKKELDFEKPQGPLSSRKTSLLLTLVAFLILLAFLIIFLFPPAKPTTLPDVRQSEPVPLPEITWEGDLPREVLKKFREASSIEEKLTCLKYPEIVQERAREFFTSGPGRNEKIIKLTRQKVGSGGATALVSNLYFLATIEGGEDRNVIITLDPKGPKIDFDFYARYGTVPWKDLLSGEIDQASEMRLVIKENHFYQGAYSDEKRWVSFKGVSPDLDQYLLLYLDRSLPEFATLSKYMGGTSLRGNFALKATSKGRETRQFEITKINALNWMTLEIPPLEPER